MSADPTVFIVDDDEAVRKSSIYLLESNGIAATAFESAAAFLASLKDDPSGCIVADFRMPAMNGLELFEELQRRRVTLPLIIVTAHADVTLCRRAMKQGAFDFLEKPLEQDLLVATVRDALRLDAQRRHATARRRQVSAQLSRLTPRESEVLQLLVAGVSVKRIAGQLEISPQTAAKHRSRVLEKLDVDNDVDLVRLVLEVGAAATPQHVPPNGGFNGAP